MSLPQIYKFRESKSSGKYVPDWGCLNCNKDMEVCRIMLPLDSTVSNGQISTECSRGFFLCVKFLLVRGSPTFEDLSYLFKGLLASEKNLALCPQHMREMTYYFSMHYAIRAMGAMSLRISELCLSFSPHPNISDWNFNHVHHFVRMQIFQISAKEINFLELHASLKKRCLTVFFPT